MSEKREINSIKIKQNKRIINIEIPALSAVIQRVLAILDKPSTTAGVIAAQIARDPGLSAKILGVANSAFYGFPHRITSLPHAIAILGINTLKGILVTLVLLEKNYDTKVKQTIITLWQHLTKSAYITKEVCSSLRMPNRSDLITAALLHDIGKAVIALNFPDETLKIQEKFAKEKSSSIEIEKEILGFTHEEVNELLCEKWLLSDVLNYVLVYHHRLDQVEHFVKETALIHFVDAIANKVEPQKEALEILEMSELKKEELIWKIESGRVSHF